MNDGFINCRTGEMQGKYIKLLWTALRERQQYSLRKTTLQRSICQLIGNC
jgi:hypothetical protein